MTLPVRWLDTVPVTQALKRRFCDMCSGRLGLPVAEVHGYSLSVVFCEDVPVHLPPLVMPGPFVLCAGCQTAVGIAPGGDQVDVDLLERRHRLECWRFFALAGVSFGAELCRLEVLLDE